MFAQRVFARSAPRMALARAPLRAPLGRRMNSSQTSKQFVGAEDNEFNRERANIVEHGAESGELWRKLCIFVAIPCIIVAVVNGKVRWDAHAEHAAHVVKEDKPEYPYQNIRTKNYFWGDGDKTLFWNDKVNFHRKDE